MTQEDLNRMVDWLNAQADKLERDEPYATNAIAALREAAEFTSAQDAEEE